MNRYDEEPDPKPSTAHIIHEYPLPDLTREGTK
jgi:hypothetical protein